MDEKAAMDRILETANLTDGLEDEDARWLIDWGLKQIPGLLQGVSDDEAAGNKVNALMAVMRRINRIVADQEAGDAQDLALEMAALAESYQQAFGQTPQAMNVPSQSLAAEIAGCSARQAMQLLLERLYGAWCASGAAPATSA